MIKAPFGGFALSGYVRVRHARGRNKNISCSRMFLCYIYTITKEIHMAHMSQDNKKRIHGLLKNVMPKDYKWSLSVKHNSMVLVLTISKAPDDLIGVLSDNGYRVDAGYASGYLNMRATDSTRQFAGAPNLVELFGKIHAAMSDGNHDNSDVISDYFDVGWYSEVHIGSVTKPFIRIRPSVKYKDLPDDAKDADYNGFDLHECSYSCGCGHRYTRITDSDSSESECGACDALNAPKRSMLVDVIQRPKK